MEYVERLHLGQDGLHRPALLGRQLLVDDVKDHPIAQMEASGYRLNWPTVVPSNEIPS